MAATHFYYNVLAVLELESRDSHDSRSVIGVISGMLARGGLQILTDILVQIVQVVVLYKLYNCGSRRPTTASWTAHWTALSRACEPAI